MKIPLKMHSLIQDFHSIAGDSVLDIRSHVVSPTSLCCVRVLALIIHLIAQRSKQINECKCGEFYYRVENEVLGTHQRLGNQIFLGVLGKIHCGGNN